MCFVKNFAQIVGPLTNLLKEKNNSQGIQWNLSWEKGFQTLKNVLTYVPILGVINSKMGELVLGTNASDLAIGAMLM